jgi:hypothetical protein
MKKQKINLKVIWTVNFKKSVYSCGISDLIGNPPPEVIGCSFDETMRIYDLQGKQIMASEFSSEITSFLAAPITQEENVELLSGDINGNIRLMNKHGKLLWDVKLKSAIMCMDVGDFLDNGEMELIFGLQNKKLILCNNKGQLLEAFIAPDSINDCTIVNHSEKLLGNLIVLLKSSSVINYDKKGRWQELYKLEDKPTVVKSIIIGEEQLLLIGNKNGSLKVIDFDGHVLGEIDLGEKIRCISRIMPLLEHDDFKFISVAAGNSLILIQFAELTKKVNVYPIKKEPMMDTLKIEDISRESTSKKDIPITEHVPRLPELDSKKIQDVRVTRGGQIEGDRYMFKIKVINEKEFNITYVNIQILSYPSESLDLILERERGGKSVDRVKINKITKGGFVSPTFMFLPKSDCIKGTIRAVVNYINEKDEVETIVMQPYEIRIICGLLKPKPITIEEFDNFSQDVINFQRVGEEIEVLIEPKLLYEKMLVLLEKKNFAILDTEEQLIQGKFFGVIKAFAEGSYSKNTLGLILTLTGIKNQKKSVLKIETFAEDKDMSPALISEIQDNVLPKICPECGVSIPNELLRKILRGEEVFCEDCGASLIGN